MLVWCVIVYIPVFVWIICLDHLFFSQDMANEANRRAQITCWDMDKMVHNGVQNGDDRGIYFSAHENGLSWQQH